MVNSMRAPWMINGRIEIITSYIILHVSHHGSLSGSDRRHGIMLLRLFPMLYLFIVLSITSLLCFHSISDQNENGGGRRFELFCCVLINK